MIKPYHFDNGNRRIEALDGIRGLAIALVMVGHANFLNRRGIDSVLGEIAHMGWIGVELFFVLSGFLITGILLDGFGRPKFLSHFYIRRFLRIVPLYYLFLALVLFLLPAAGVPGFWPYQGPTFYYWLFLSNIGMCFFGLPHHPFLLLTWTLSIEEQFYLIWPFLVAASGKKRLVAASLLILCGTLSLRILMLILGADKESVYTFTLARLDSLAVGSAISALVRSKSPRWSWIVWSRRLIFGASIAIVVIRFVDEWIAPALSDYKGPCMQSLGYTCLAVLFGSLLVLGLMEGDGFWLKRFQGSVLRFLGRYSYAMYLFHMPVIYFTKEPFRRSELARGLELAGSEFPAQVLYTIFVFIAASIVSQITWHLWEKHFLRLKVHFQ